MKRFLTVILTLVMTFSVVCASAQVPEFLVREYPNYTADYSITLSFESSDELVALLDEIEMPEEVSYFVNIKALLKSLLSQNVNMNLQMNTSEDFRKAEYALTTDSVQAVDINSNLSIDFDTKVGMWMKMDLDAEVPVFEIIYSAPFLNKYFVMDIFDLAEEAEITEILALYDKLFSKEYMDSITAISKDMLEKYADIKVTGSTCTVKYDNEAFVGMLNELFPAVLEKTYALFPDFTNINYEAFADVEGAEGELDATSVAVIGGADGPTSVFVTPEAENDFVTAFVPDFTGFRLLGEEGLTYKFNLYSGKISKAEMKADFSFDISELVKGITGAEWQYETSGIMDFVLDADVKLSNIGSTKVQFPVLTEENSFGIEDFISNGTEPDYGYEEYEPYYPYYYAWAEAEELPVIDGEIYVPLRAVLEGAYADTVEIEYNKGVVVAKSQYFPDFEKITLTVNSGDVYTSGTLHKCSKVIIRNNRVYVGRTLFEEIFGWELVEASHNLVDDYYSVGFYTESF